ncbi:MAG: hypothetical protein ABF755_01000 [Oenococcus oeni]
MSDIYVDRYGIEHGDIKGMLVLYDTKHDCYVRSALKCHIKITPSINNAIHFQHLDGVFNYMELHDMADYRYEIRADNS